MKHSLFLALLILISCNKGGGSKTANSSGDDTDMYLSGQPQLVNGAAASCISHTADSLPQNECQQIGGTHTTVNIPSISYCEITTDQSNCTSNNGSWTPGTKACKDVAESDCAPNNGTWTASKACIIAGKSFVRGTGYFSENEADLQCTKYGSLSAGGSCAIATQGDCTAANGNWSDVSPGTCGISNQTDCDNANGTWRTFAASTVNSCVGYDITSSLNCSVAHGTWNEGNKIMTVSGEFQPQRGLSGKVRVQYYFWNANYQLPSASSRINSVTMKIQITETPASSNVAWEYTSVPTLSKGIYVYDDGANHTTGQKTYAFVVDSPIQLDAQNFNEYFFSYKFILDLNL